MTNNIEHIELINQYINKELSEADRKTFESKLKMDAAFNELYQEQLIFIKGLKRVEIITEIKNAKQNYIRAKWIKYIGFSVGIVLISVLVYAFFFKSDITQMTSSKTDNLIETVSDSTVVKKPSEVKTEESSIITKQTKTIEKDTIRKENLKMVSEPLYEDVKVNKDSVESLVKHNPKVEPKPLSPELISFFKSIKKTPQVISVNTEEAFTVTCKEGTVLRIPAKSFVDAKTGKLVRGTINLEVTEYYKLTDVLLANLNTKSNEKLLETGGMLNINAYKKDSKLKLKQGKAIKITFKNTGKKGMQLFSGKNDGHVVNWIPQSNTIVEEDVEVALDVVENVPVFPGCQYGDNSEKIKCMKEKIDKFFSKKFNTNIAEELDLTGTHKISVFFKVNKNGDIEDAVARASNIELAQEAIRLVDLLPKMIPAKQRGINVRVPYYFPIKFKIDGATVNRRSIIEARSIKTSNYLQKQQIDSVGIEYLNKRDIVRYAFSSTNLGWINCDRFVRMRPKKRYKLKINNSDNVDVKLVFKSINGILPSKNYGETIDFGWVPDKEEYIILIAIKKDKNELFLGVEQRKISNDSNLNFDYKKVTVEELKQKLSELESFF